MSLIYIQVFLKKKNSFIPKFSYEKPYTYIFWVMLEMQIILQVSHKKIKKKNYFINYFTNGYCGEGLLVNKKLILVVDHNNSL